MKLLNRKMQLFCISNVVLSFACTGYLGLNYYSDAIGNEILSNSEVAMLDGDVDPLSQYGGEDYICVASPNCSTKPLENQEMEDSKIKEVMVAKAVMTKATKNTTKVTSIVTKKEVKKSAKYMPAKYSSVTGNAVVNYAKRYLGLRYVSGGNSLTTGTDCSGFTKLIYKEFGVTLSRAVAGQARNGSYVSKSDLQKGDLVFYGYGNGVIRHVGIYIGNGQVLHESTPKSGVKISSVNMMQYITARRVINNTAIKKVEEHIKKEKQITEDKKDETKSDVILNNTDNKVTEQEMEDSKKVEDKTVEIVKTDEVKKDNVVKQNETITLEKEENTDKSLDDKINADTTYKDVSIDSKEEKQDTTQEKVKEDKNISQEKEEVNNIVSQGKEEIKDTKVVEETKKVEDKVENKASTTKEEVKKVEETKEVVSKKKEVKNDTSIKEKVKINDEKNPE